ncbi:uncharacterized protein LOC106074921 [Biomphalaria glabrata]|uniref:Uncharacterized protein LOC106074921 n=1 Tax=Biomphalaria glabrata TaxID=6526 RepID=A0A9W3BCZ5_BIOGL|nr:uncharacterized protein LOC106074921 [Biomphalaria glabrata]KAI8779303.1 hypothetical protein BgiBS90_020285 [Biomphalaria glabrata]
MLKWRLIFTTLILYTVYTVTESKNKERESESETADEESEEWYDPCESIWWNKLYRVEQPRYQEFEHFLDCLRDYDGIYVAQRELSSLGHGRNVPRGWWTRYRAHTRNHPYPLTLETYEEFESYIDDLKETFVVAVDRFNFQAFWNETDIPEEWWTQYEATHTKPAKNPDRSKTGKVSF